MLSARSERVFEWDGVCLEERKRKSLRGEREDGRFAELGIDSNKGSKDVSVFMKGPGMMAITTLRSLDLMNNCEYS